HASRLASARRFRADRMNVLVASSGTLSCPGSVEPIVGNPVELVASVRFGSSARRGSVRTGEDPTRLPTNSHTATARNAATTRRHHQLFLFGTRNDAGQRGRATAASEQLLACLRLLRQSPQLDEPLSRFVVV